MALLTIDDVLELGVGEGIVAVTWVVARDGEDIAKEDFSDIVDENIRSTTDIETWKTPLYRNGEYYTGKFPIKARCKLHYENLDSEWYYFDKCISEIKDS